jgi:ADP-ribose pyrophosphatase
LGFPAGARRRELDANMSLRLSSCETVGPDFDFEARHTLSHSIIRLGEFMEMTNPEANIRQHDEIYNGIIVRLARDVVRLDSGRDVVREVVRHPGGVVVLPVTDSGSLVFVRQFRYPLSKYILELPAGKLDTGQPPLETIRCELEEEAGFRASDIRRMFSFYTTPGISDEEIHFFVARGLTAVPPNRGEGEHITVETYPVEEALRMVESGEIADAKTIIGILWYRLKYC